MVPVCFSLTHLSTGHTGLVCLLAEVDSSGNVNLPDYSDQIGNVFLGNPVKIAKDGTVGGTYLVSYTPLSCMSLNSIRNPVDEMVSPEEASRAGDMYLPGLENLEETYAKYFPMEYSRKVQLEEHHAQFEKQHEAWRAWLAENDIPLILDCPLNPEIESRLNQKRKEIFGI